MVYTRHGHHIDGTVLDKSADKPPVARCGGPALCANCALDVQGWKLKHTDWHEDICAFNEGTLFKVRDALYKAGLTKAECTEAIQEMQNAGILFRERLPYINEDGTLRQSTA